MSSTRRSFLAGSGLGALAGLGTLAAAPLSVAPLADAAAPGRSDAAPAPVAFEGEHQAGILDTPRAASTIVSLDVEAANADGLRELMRTLTQRCRALTSADAFDPAAHSVTDTPLDTGTLGPSPSPDRLGITVSVGASLFDERFGLASRKPARLTDMDVFDGDRLDPERTGGDLSLLISADSRDTVLHALRDLLRQSRGAAVVRWKQDGFTPAPRPSGAPRNHFGFKDGTANPDVNDQVGMTRLVWADDADQPWTAGGSYQVVRLIRMYTEFWDRISLGEQNNIFGRDRATGAPLDGTSDADEPNYTLDPRGSVIPMTAHMRLANPRTAATDGQRILRRAFNYESGMDDAGNLDVGQVFVCYQADIAGQFATIQRRLAEDPLNDYISHVGGGYFLALPGVRGADDFLGSALLS